MDVLRNQSGISANLSLKTTALTVRQYVTYQIAYQTISNLSMPPVEFYSTERGNYMSSLQNKDSSNNYQLQNDKEFIFRPWRKDSKSGEILWAKNYGLKAWKIPVDPDYSPN